MRRGKVRPSTLLLPQKSITLGAQGRRAKAKERRAELLNSKTLQGKKSTLETAKRKETADSQTYPHHCTDSENLHHPHFFPFFTKPELPRPAPANPNPLSLPLLHTGTLDNPIIVYSAGEEQYAGCTGYPVDSHWTIWLGMDRQRPMERCTECGSVYRMEYIGPPDDGHGHGHGHGHHHAPGEPEYDVYRDGHPDLIAEQNKPRFSDLVRPEYRWN